MTIYYSEIGQDLNNLHAKKVMVLTDPKVRIIIFCCHGAQQKKQITSST